MSQVMQLKGSSFTLTVLQLSSSDIAQMSAELAAKIELAPNFFKHAPVVVDISRIEEKEKLDFNVLKQTLLKHDLVPVGIKGAEGEALQEIVADAGFACMGEGNFSAAAPVKAKTKAKAKVKIESEPRVKEVAREEPDTQYRYSKTITKPVRSGQQVYSPGDLVVLARVSPGAELLAEGNVHVYERMGGRVLAGINGDRDARIFCTKLEAELVSIAGEYQVFEHTKYPHMSQPTQIYLKKGEGLTAEPL